MQIDQLKPIAFWARDLTNDELARAAAGTTVREFSSGSYICHRGDRLDHWTGVVSGLVKLGAVSPAGKAITFAGIGAGGWFGEGSVLKREPRQYDVFALTDTRLALMNEATFFWLYENSITFTRCLVRLLNERMGQFIGTIELDRIHDPAVRVARHLAALRDPLMSPNVGATIEIGKDELALLAGLSRPVATKALQQLEADGPVKAVRGGVTLIADREALSRYER